MERHSTDLVSLFFGLLFIAVAIIGLSPQLELSTADVRWLAPAILVLLGILLVLPIGRGRSAAEEAVPGGRAEPPRAGGYHEAGGGQIAPEDDDVARDEDRRSETDTRELHRDED